MGVPRRALVQYVTGRRKPPPPEPPNPHFVPGYGGYQAERGARKIYQAQHPVNDGAPPTARNTSPRQKPPRHPKRPSRKYDQGNWNRGNNQRS